MGLDPEDQPEPGVDAQVRGREPAGDAEGGVGEPEGQAGRRPADVDRLGEEAGDQPGARHAARAAVDRRLALFGGAEGQQPAEVGPGARLLLLRRLRPTAAGPRLRAGAVAGCDGRRPPVGPPVPGRRGPPGPLLHLGDGGREVRAAVDEVQQHRHDLDVAQWHRLSHRRFEKLMRRQLLYRA